MLLSVLEAWDGYHAAAPEARDCVGNTWDKPWDPIPSAFNYGIGIAGAVFAIHVAANSPFALGILPHSALIALQFAVSYAICVAYINVVVTTRPHPFKGKATAAQPAQAFAHVSPCFPSGRQGNYSDTLLICIASPWVIWMSFGWSDDVRECMRLDSERWYLGFLAPAGLLVGLHVVYLSRKFQTVASSWSIRQLRVSAPRAVCCSLLILDHSSCCTAAAEYAHVSIILPSYCHRCIFVSCHGPLTLLCTARAT